MNLAGKEITELPVSIKNQMSNWNRISDYIYDKNMTSNIVFDMVAYEVATKNRHTVVSRLLSRYSKLHNKEFMEKFNAEREGYRSVSKKAMLEG